MHADGIAIYSYPAIYIQGHIAIYASGSDGPCSGL